ncbi:nodulation protein NodH [Limimaricola sp. G21655-S1]|uniref:nodulation protein NodH n=1 Tax=Limimaricola sp. G21655-S1 TaxID=3014768 RepID=UPI0022AF3C44|nr:nodulation protein NodH [Limimaricola sp. G21655-S1]MCZ4261254.1 nodulation protein NodH [Limimaricola sp. G21655-S1]
MPEFDSFVVLAEMRTGSNFLEANLNALDGVRCHGEAFNPHFIGSPQDPPILGFDRAARDADPTALLARLRAAPGLNGFRYFGDHDPRLFGPIMDEPRIAKIVLTRNPLDSYVSHRIAAATGQWKLTDARHARAARIRFEPEGFEAHLQRLQETQIRIMGALQRSGQTAFYVDYADLQDVEVLNGLAAWLGVTGRLDALDRGLKKQNPGPIADKVENVEEMQAALARIDRFDLHRTPNFEPRRGAMVPGYIAAATTGLLCLPLTSGPEAALRHWLEALDGAPVREGFTQKTLRDWRRAHPGHRSFAVLRHPVARAHAAFCDRILSTGPGSYGEIRDTLRRRHGLPIDAAANGPDPDPARHRAAFLQFAGFLKANLGGQTALRVDAAWASQSALLQGAASVESPDAVLRETELARDLPWIAAQLGREAPPWRPAQGPQEAALVAIYDAEVERAIRTVYARDYDRFGFEDWQPLPG